MPWQLIDIMKKSATYMYWASSDYVVVGFTAMTGQHLAENLVVSDIKRLPSLHVYRFLCVSVKFNAEFQKDIALD